MTHQDIILEVFALLRNTPIWKQNTPSELLKILMYVHSKGWLYVKPEIDNKVALAICAYRIKEYNEETPKKLPEKEEGDILYIPLLASIYKNHFQIKRILVGYIREFFDVKEIVWESMKKKEKLCRKIIKPIELVGRKENQDGKIKESVITDTSDGSSVSIHKTDH